MTPRPLTPDELANLRATVARDWPACAEAQGILPGEIRISDGTTMPEGELWPWYAYPAAYPRHSTLARALEGLSRVLEDAGYALERRGSARIVLGWAMLAGRRVCDLDPGEEPRRSYHERLTDEREVRDRAERGPVGLYGKDKMLAVAYARAAGGR